jgi:hypothetical protein
MAGIVITCMKGGITMEWNFLFRIDHLNEKGEERNLKGTIFTDGEAPPSAEAIQVFLRQCGYNVGVEDKGQLVFRDSRPADPVEIRIVKLGNEERADHEAAVRAIAEQFRKQDPPIG